MSQNSARTTERTDEATQPVLGGSHAPITFPYLLLLRPETPQGSLDGMGLGAESYTSALHLSHKPISEVDEVQYLPSFLQLTSLNLFSERETGFIDISLTLSL